MDTAKHATNNAGATLMADAIVPRVAPRRQPASATHYRRPVSRPFTRAERAKTTILISGLSSTHERLAEAALQSLGYSCRALPTPDLQAYETGKEYQNNAYCNPAYFLVGNLIKYLQGLKADGMTSREIVDRYVYLTAGSCGTCRFGMYEEEYELALRNAGFDGFRVLTFSIDRAPDQVVSGAGLEMNFDFFLALANALNIGDILNQFVCRIRPYEVDPGKTDEVLHSVIAMMSDVLRNRTPFQPSGAPFRIFAAMGLRAQYAYAAKVVHQLRSRDLVDAVARARTEFDSIELDRLRVRPIVKVIGEFWAQSTDGDGNFRMVRFLEQERAEAYVDRMIGTRITYLFHMAQQMARAKKHIDGEGRALTIRHPRRLLSGRIRYAKKMAMLTLGIRLYKRENQRLLRVLGGGLHEIVDQRTLQRLAAPYYEWRCASGEGHLEVAENIYYHTHGLCHMVLGLKPFGCMPSTQSDGAQAAVLNEYGDLIYLPIETSGDSEILAYSRVQMALSEARERAGREFDEALARAAYDERELRSYVAARPELKRPSYSVPSSDGVVGRAALFVLHVSELMEKSEEKDRMTERVPATAGLLREVEL
jgi:predicted nucleotide-binding protein (sugar kinase/HSP70/actin superfamily)